MAPRDPRGPVANDLIAFQLPRDQRNFLNAVSEELGASVSGEAVYLGSRPVRVVAIPIGADFDRISSILQDASLRTGCDGIRQELGLGDKVVGVGVDRLDYTKGIPERIAAIARVPRGAAGPRRPVRVRADWRAVAERGARVCGDLRRDRRAGRRGQSSGSPERTAPGPILYVKKAFELPDLVALYRLANFCIVSSLHDGMNLVAKEFVAARDDLDGVLILSELAGASEELSEALLDQSLRRARALRRPSRARSRCRSGSAAAGCRRCGGAWRAATCSPGRRTFSTGWNAGKVRASSLGSHPQDGQGQLRILARGRDRDSPADREAGICCS